MRLGIIGTLGILFCVIGTLLSYTAFSSMDKDSENFASTEENTFWQGLQLFCINLSILGLGLILYDGLLLSRNVPGQMNR